MGPRHESHGDKCMKVLLAGRTGTVLSLRSIYRYILLLLPYYSSTGIFIVLYSAVYGTGTVPYLYSACLPYVWTILSNRTIIL